MDFYEEIEIGEHEAEMFGRGLYAVARAEGGVHEREEALIASFLDEVAGGKTTLASLARLAPPSPEELASVITRPEAARLFLKTALLLAYVDGSFAPEERTLILDFASALGVSDKELATMEQGVREYLLGHLVHLKNVDAVRRIAKELGM